ncbi:MAG: hypothetical protein K2Q20_13210, partial [Phycisphaerales bacterium]|nr:hypothetical protein [Phycisphaerales bacterium]
MSAISTPSSGGAAARTSPQPGRKVFFKIKRCEGPGKPSRWETFSVPIETGSNVISCLQHIA